jgi:hypothetical protein
MEILERILNDSGNRMIFIKEFQNLIWNAEESIEVLKDLAYDLDFYEPDEVLRMQDPSYFGNERLEKEIKAVLKKLKTIL